MAANRVVDTNDPQLPTFRYHPDPLATGSVEPSTTQCVVCGQARGSIYTGPVYAEGDYADQICPWCIADGSAHTRLNAEFTDPGGIGGYGDWDDVPDSIIEEVTYRTPGFATWQGERWFTHCNDAAAFRGPAGYKELKAFGQAAIEAIQTDADMEGEQWEELYRGLQKDGSPTAYVFRCRHCGVYGGYQDCD